LHFALTGTAWEGTSPLNFLASGGVPVGDEDVGYGPARVLDPAGVSALNAALATFSMTDFERNFDPASLSKAEIYPQIWDEPLDDLKEEYGSYLNEMKAHVQRAAGAGQAMLVAIR
jgi:predicted S18 family serine protease